MILGAGELGKEVAISAKRLGQRVIAVDNYKNAPAMQVADGFEIIDMLDANALEEVVVKHQPNLIIPEVEAIRTTKLQEFEEQGIIVAPTAKATHITMNRDAVRDLARKELKLKTANYLYAENYEDFKNACTQVGFPCVVKPVMSSSGKGQSTLLKASEIKKAWNTAINGARGDIQKVIVEEFIKFDFEITLLTVKQKNGKTLFLPPIGHRQEHGDYRESWIPACMSHEQIRQAQKMAKKMTDHLGGAGVFGVEFFVTSSGVIFSEVSPRPHDTGMVTLVSQNLSEFDLHVRAVLGLPIPEINYYGPSASSVILSNRNECLVKGYSGISQALEIKGVDVRIFGKEVHRKGRRMGVTLASGKSLKQAIAKVKKASQFIRVL